jgi:hypothetical protein
MFGKTTWFREKKVGWGVRPATWQGWAYSAAWMLVVTAPFLFLLLVMHRTPEAAIWMGVSLVAMFLDVRSIARQIRAEVRRKEDENILYIGDDDAGEVQTRNYKLQLRN